MDSMEWKEERGPCNCVRYFFLMCWFVDGLGWDGMV